MLLHKRSITHLYLSSFLPPSLSLISQVYYFSKLLALIVMHYVPPPHIILRKALIRGDTLSTLASDLR